MGERAARGGLGGGEFDVAVDGHEPRGEAGGTAAHLQAHVGRFGLETEDVGLHFGLHAHEAFEPGQFFAQEPGHVGARHDDLAGVDFPEGLGQQLVQRPEVAAAENPAVLAGHEIGREFRAAHEGQLGVRHQQQFAVLVVEVHAQHAAHAGGVDRQLAAALFFQRPALLQGQQVEEIGDPEEHFVGHGPAGDFFEHEEDGFVVGDQAQHDVVRHASDGMPRAAEFELDPHRHLPGQGPLAPVARQDQVQRAVERAGRARFRALEEGLRGDLAQMARAAFFLLDLALALGIVVARQQRQAQGDDVGADDAALHVVAARTQVFAGVVRQDPRGGLDGAAAPGNGALHVLAVGLGVQHQAAFEQRAAVPEGDGAPPVLQHLGCKRQFHVRPPPGFRRQTKGRR